MDGVIILHVLEHVESLHRAVRASRSTTLHFSTCGLCHTGLLFADRGQHDKDAV